MTRLRRRKRPLDYLLPFLVLASVVIIGVLGFQMIASWGKDKKGDVYFYTVRGNSRILPFSQKDWDDAGNGKKLLLGDSLKTSAQGRGVLQFFNGTIMRMGDDTAITLVDVNKTNDHELISVQLQNGNLWVNGNKTNDIKESSYKVRSPHLSVEAKGTIFTVESSDTVDSVKVLAGEATIDVIDVQDDKEQVLDSFEVLQNQQFVLDDVALEALRNNKEVSLRSNISEDVLASEWYRWNKQEDETPSDFSSLDTSSSSTTNKDQTDADTQNPPTDSGNTPPDTKPTTTESVKDPSKQPVILQPSFTSTTTNKFILSGTVPSGTEKVIVETVIGSDSQKYTLSKFKKGDTSWQYNVAESFGNFKKGENTYKVYAINGEGGQSEPAVLTITYGAVDGTTSNTTTNTNSDAGLTAPTVSTFNGSSSSVTTQSSVKIVGTVQGADKVVINGYTLQQFTPGSTAWSYTAKESLGNLKAGTNTFSVYAVDHDGNKSEVTTFTITYNKPKVAKPAVPTNTSRPKPVTPAPVTPTAPKPVG